jgi:hypothetical protein
MNNVDMGVDVISIVSNNNTLTIVASGRFEWVEGEQYGFYVVRV